MRILLILLSFYSFDIYAVDFNQYCQFNKGGEDCSEEFILALTDASITKESITLKSNETFVLNEINTAGIHLSDINIIGLSDSTKKPIIKTNKLYLFDINDLLIDNIKIMGINNDEGETEQSNTLVLIGAKDKYNKANNITITNSEFENSAEDLLVFWNTQKVIVKNNIFKRSGLAMRIAETIGDPNDLRPRGSGLLFHNIINASIESNEFYEMKKFAVFLDGSDILDDDIRIFDNHIDMLNFEKPTKRYGLKGGAGIYIGNSTNSQNIHILNNRILNYTMNGMRINGDNIIVKNNSFNFNSACTTADQTISSPLVGMAIKAHFLTNSKIENNCVQNTAAGIVLESWENIENINISQNSIYGAITPFYFVNKYGGQHSNITKENNTISDAVPEKEKNTSSGSLYILLLISSFFALKKIFKSV